MGGGKYKIVLEDKAQLCKVPHCRNFLAALQDKLKAKLDELAAQGLISEVQYPPDLVGPIVVGSKPASDDIRLCVEFRQLNRYSKREYYHSVQEAVQSI